MKNLLRLAFERRLGRIHVAHKDRLCRFGFDLVEYVLNQHGATIVVDANSSPVSDEQELAEDVLSIVTVFGARLHGKRSGQGRKRQREKATEVGAVGSADGTSSSEGSADESSGAVV